jgi:hypothetical protein
LDLSGGQFNARRILRRAVALGRIEKKGIGDSHSGRRAAGRPQKLGHAEGLRLIAARVGLGIALALAGVLRSFLFGLQPTDPVTLLSVGFLFVAVALPGCVFSPISGVASAWVLLVEILR